VAALRSLGFQGLIGMLSDIRVVLFGKQENCHENSVISHQLLPGKVDFDLRWSHQDCHGTWVDGHFV
jgi:hypothetical protein